MANNKTHSINKNKIKFTKNEEQFLLENEASNHYIPQ